MSSGAQLGHPAPQLSRRRHRQMSLCPTRESHIWVVVGMKGIRKVWDGERLNLSDRAGLVGIVTKREK